MKQKVHQILRLLTGLAAISRAKAAPRLLPLYCDGVCSKLQAPGQRKGSRLLLFFTVLFITSNALAQTISGNTSVCVGSATPLSATVTGGAWSSSLPTVAAVSATGVVSGVATGTAVISYTVSGATVTTTITVNSVLNAGSIAGPATICIDSSIMLTNSVSGGVWSSDNSVISVNSATGVITAVAMGSANIMYTVSNSCGSAGTAINVVVNGYTNDIYTFAGTGISGFSGDGGPAYLAQMGDPRDLFVEAASGTLYFCDPANNRVREITRAGIISTVAGNGNTGNGGDGGPATAATLNAANGVFVDNAGNMFISNTGVGTIRKVSPAGIITTIAGTGVPGLSGDGGPATLAQLDFPLGVLEDAAGNVYFADQAKNNVREIIAATGIINTVAGSSTGVAGYSGDGGPATAALMQGVRGLTMDNKGNIYIADATNNAIRKYVPSTGIITTIAGTGTAGHTGDGGPATAATLTVPARFAYDGANNLYLSDQENNAIRVINLATGIISHVAGIYESTGSYSGDFGSALSANLNTPAGIAGDHFGNFYIADAENNRIRVVPSTGSLSASIVGPDTVCAGTAVSFTAFLSSTGSPTYQWQKNDVNVGGGGSSYTDPSPSDGDVYRCIVTVTPGCSAAFMDTSNNIKVSVNQMATTIETPTTIYPGQSEQLTETVPGGAWSSSSTGIATISPTGMLYGVSGGAAVITYAVTNACGTSTTNVSVLISAPDTILALSGANGAILPAGPVIVDGGGQTFYFTPDSGYQITNVIVNGISVGIVSSYTFSSVTANQTISVTFAPICTAPAISACPGNVTVNNTPGACGAAITYAGVTVTGTSPAITYSQSSGTSFPVGTTVVTVNATNSCGSASCSFAVTVNDNQAPSITAPANVTVTGHCGAATVSLGTPVTSDNCGAASITNNAPATFAPGTTIVTWTATDVHGNTATATQTVTVVPATITVSASVKNVSCYGLSNGNIVVSATGGTSPYSYIWSGGDATTATLAAVPAGSYSVAVVDANGCSASANYSVAQSASALSVSGTVSNVRCHGSGTGSIATTVTGGTGAYSYAWSNGASTAGLSNITSGTYSVTVTDANSCTTTAAYSVTQPASALSVSGTVSNESCYGASAGSISTSVSGGTSSYSYSWNTGASTANITNKAAGTYSVTVTDAASCTASASFTITQPSAITISGTVTNETCYGSSTGSISTSVSGGTSPYTYSWSGASATTSSLSGKSAGTYTVTVTDSHGCTAVQTITITQPAQLLSTITGDTSVLGGVMDTFYAPVQSGASYSWSVSGSGVNISGSSSSSSLLVEAPCTATSYTVGLTVAQGGCSSSSVKHISVTQSAQLTVYCALYTTSSGFYPTVNKSSLSCNIKVYDRHICGPQDGVQSHYSSVYAGTTGQITQCAISAPTYVIYGGGPAYQYSITVPANGHYLVIGQCNVSTSSYFGGSSNCTIYTGQKAGDYDCVDGSDHTNDYPLTPCTTPQNLYHSVVQDNTGHCVEGCTQQEIGSLLLIVSPVALEFDDSVASLPVIYESVEGDWSASVTATTPEGFYSIPADSLSTSVTDSNINAVQFSIADTGSVWTNTDLTHTLFHKGATRIVHTLPKMINHRNNKLATLTLDPNPTRDMVNIGFPTFEGKVNISVYDMVGQRMLYQRASISEGTTVSLDVSMLPPGVYMVTGENGTSKASARLVKQ